MAPRHACPTLQWVACMTTPMASPCRSLVLYFEGVNFMDLRALDGGRGGGSDATERRETLVEPPGLPHVHFFLTFRHSEGSGAEMASWALVSWAGTHGP